MVSLDTYRDNMCLWRCIAVHKGARPDRSTKAAQGLAKSFFKLRDTRRRIVQKHHWMNWKRWKCT